MKVLIDGLNEFYGENIRLIKTLMKRESAEEHPEHMKWALQMLYFDGRDWIEVCRIDNYLHEKQQGSHIHLHGKEKVKWIGLNFEEAEKAIKGISARILKGKFNQDVTF